MPRSWPLKATLSHTRYMKVRITSSTGRTNRWAQFKDGNYNLCSMDIRMPYGASDRSWHGATDKYSGKRFDTMKEWGDYLPKCQQVSWLTVESNAEARDQAIHDVLEFLKQGQ